MPPNEHDSYWRLSQWFPFLSEEQQLSFLKQRDFILRYKDKINLISKHTVREMDQIHFADSILGCRFIQHYLYTSSILWKDSVLYDFGSGNGFPGIVFSILYPDCKVCLVETKEKKSIFLKQLIHLLQLKNASVFHGSTLSFEEKSIALVITRAYQAIADLLSAHNKIFSFGAHVFHFKGKNWEKEKAELPIKYQKEWETTLLATYQLPDQQVKKDFHILRSSYKA